MSINVGTNVTFQAELSYLVKLYFELYLRCILVSVLSHVGCALHFKPAKFLNTCLSALVDKVFFCCYQEHII